MFIASVIYKGTKYFVRSTILTEYRERATEFKTETDAIYTPAQRDAIVDRILGLEALRQSRIHLTDYLFARKKWSRSFDPQECVAQLDGLGDELADLIGAAHREYENLTGSEYQ